jgi:outer membrane protein assembly factor BamB
MQRLLFLVLILISCAANSQITAQWRGADRDGVYPGEGLALKWPAEGPVLSWSVSGIGKGFSSAVSDGRAVYVTGMIDTMDVLSAISMEGKILWQRPFGRSWTGSFPETRTTPTVDGDNIYVISGSGIIACIDRNDGNIRWSLDGVKKFSGVFGTWGISESPLIVDNKLIYTPAGNATTMVALNKENGETIWMSPTLNDTGAYVSPRLIRFKGKDIIVTITGKWFFGADASDGNILWKFNYAALDPEEGLKIWPGAPKTNTITPLYRDGDIYITGGYNHPGVMFRISEKADAVTLLWKDTTLDCHHGGVVLIGNYIYGSNWIDNGRGNWCCVDWKTGKAGYNQNWNTKGSVITAGGMLYCFEEKNGNVGLVKATPEKFEPVSSFKIPLGKGPCWAHPSIQGHFLFIRHGDVVMAYNISAG